MRRALNGARGATLQSSSLSLRRHVRVRMIHRHSLLALIAVLALFAAPGRAAADEIKPPFGLHWGETTTRMERLLSGAHAKIVQRRMVGGREVWEVDGILTNDLQRTLFYFTNNELVEVELQYK